MHLACSVQDEDLGNEAGGDDITFSILSHNYVGTGECAVEDQNEGGFCCQYSESVFDIVKRASDSMVILKESFAESLRPLNNLAGCSLTMTVQATDAGGLTSNTATFTFEVSGTNEAPSLEDVTFGPIPENPVEGTVVTSSLSGVDLDVPAQELKYFIVDQGELDRFNISKTTGEIWVTALGSATLDYESDSLGADHSVR
tara:strand:- start:258 stop:857 length:600 start_codon:yes stop_codon:yes gene_type:complete